MTDGHIKIDIVGNDKDLQRKLKEIEKLEKEKAKIEVKIESRGSDYTKIERELNRQIDKYYEMLDKKALIEAKKITMPAMNLGTGVMPEESFYLEKDQAELDKINAKIDDQNFKMDELQAKQRSLVALREQDESVLEGINGKLAVASAEADKVQLTNMNKSIGDVSKNLSKVGSGIKDVIGKVGKWALALFGVRSAYMAIRRLMSTLSQFNEQLKTDLSYISFSIAKVFEPVILKIVQLVFQALQLINSIVGALFGVNLFAKATADAFQKGNAGVGGMVDNARKLKRELAGFDEMNRLMTGLDETSGGGAGGGIAPSIDLSENLVNPFDKIKKWWEEFKTWLDPDIAKALQKIVDGAKLKFDGIAKVGKGAWKIIQGALTGDVDLMIEGFKDMGEGFSDVLDGMLLSGEGWKELFLKTLGTFWQAIKRMAKEELDGLKVIIDYYASRMMLKAIEMGNEWQMRLSATWYNIKSRLGKWWNEMVGNFKQIWSGITQFISGAFTGDWNKAWTGVKNIFLGIWNLMKTGVKTAINGIIGVVNAFIRGMNRLNATSWIPGMQPVGIVREIQYLAKGGIVNYPNHGVPVGRAMAGESGAEGVIPLTDSQAMAELGQAIGRWITVNNTINTQVGSRTVAREIQRVQNQDNFALNGGLS